MANTSNLKPVLALQHTMKAGFLLGLYFMVEYVIVVKATQNLSLSFLHVVMMCLTPYLMYRGVRGLKKLFVEEGLSAFRAWMYGVQLMFFAGLLEALFVYVYNAWLFPTNLHDMQMAMLAQWQQVATIFQQSNMGQISPSFMQTVKEMQEAVQNMDTHPIQVAFTSLSNDITYGLLWMIPLCFFLRQKPQPATPSDDKISSDDKSSTDDAADDKQ